MYTETSTSVDTYPINVFNVFPYSERPVSKTFDFYRKGMWAIFLVVVKRVSGNFISVRKLLFMISASEDRIKAYLWSSATSTKIENVSRLPAFCQ